jgi:alpha-D-ribose 1-methylphosphonate 5-triphosphate synthase subunit PhnG
MPDSPPQNPRAGWIGTLARAPGAAIADRLAGLDLPPHERLRGPETGLVMLRGRAGGDGAAFNLGEMTVTRCSVRLADGTVGHAWRAGRDLRAAELSALLDALLQDPARRGALQAGVIAPLAAAEAAAADAASRKAAATRVEFFAMGVMR